MKWINRFAMSSVIPVVGCPSAVFRVNNPVSALLRRATSGRQTLFGICHGLLDICEKVTELADTGVFLTVTVLGGPVQRRSSERTKCRTQGA